MPSSYGGAPTQPAAPAYRRALGTPPRCSGRAYSSLKNHPSVSAFPDSTIGSACTSSFSRFARRSLALRPAHSRSHLGDRYPRASDILSPPCLPRLLPAGANRRVGLAPTGKAPPCHGARGKRKFSGCAGGGQRRAPFITQTPASGARSNARVDYEIETLIGRSPPYDRRRQDTDLMPEGTTGGPPSDEVIRLLCRRERRLWAGSQCPVSLPS